MKIAVISDIHDNLPRLAEALKICREANIENCICCGDVGQLETLDRLSSAFANVYLALGNADFSLLNRTGLFPENIAWNKSLLAVELDGLKVAIVHHDHKAKELARKGEYDYIFYGHTHTPWEKRIGRTTILNPGEIAGQYGPASFGIFDTETKKTILKVLA